MPIPKIIFLTSNMDDGLSLSSSDQDFEKEVRISSHNGSFNSLNTCWSRWDASEASAFSYNGRARNLYNFHWETTNKINPTTAEPSAIARRLDRLSELNVAVLSNESLMEQKIETTHGRTTSPRTKPTERHCSPRQRGCKLSYSPPRLHRSSRRTVKASGPSKAPVRKLSLSASIASNSTPDLLVTGGDNKGSAVDVAVMNPSTTTKVL